MEHFINHLPPQSVWIGLGLLGAATLLVALARRVGVSWVDTLGLFAGCVVAGGLISRLFWGVLEPTVTYHWLSAQGLSLVDPRRGGHSSFGAMTGGLGVLGIWWWASQKTIPHAVRARTLDILVLAGLLGMGLARVGCLANGCDFGRRSDLSWAVRHRAGTEAFLAHLNVGLIEPGAPESLAVHPFALYLALGVAVIVGTGTILVWRRRPRPGQVAMGAAGAYLLWRFLTEWTRDPATVIVIWKGFNIHHLMAIVAGFACLIVWKSTETRYNFTKRE